MIYGAMRLSVENMRKSKKKELMTAFREQVQSLRNQDDMCLYAHNVDDLVADFVSITLRLQGKPKETAEDMMIAVCVRATQRVRRASDETDIEIGVIATENIANTLYKNVEDKDKLKTLQQLFLDEAMLQTEAYEHEPKKGKAKKYKHAAKRYANLYQKFHHKLVASRK